LCTVQAHKHNSLIYGVVLHIVNSHRMQDEPNKPLRCHCGVRVKYYEVLPRVKVLGLSMM
jgi:hypothetical protein